MSELSPELAEIETKPTLRELLNRYVAGDSHEHTVFSNPATRHEADYTFEQVFEYIKNEMKPDSNGMEYVIFAEHSSDAGNPELVDGQDLLNHHRSIHEFMDQVHQTEGQYPELISGVETSIISAEGDLDVPQEVLAQMDMVIASKHDMKKAFPESGGNPTAEQLTHMYISIMDNPHVDVIGHPNRYVSWESLSSMDWGSLFAKAVETNTALEININAPMPEWLIKKAVEAGVPLFIGTDAHSLTEYQRLPEGVEAEGADDRLQYPLGVRHGFWRKMSRILRALDEVGASKEQIITSSYEGLNRWLSAEKKDRDWRAANE